MKENNKVMLPYFSCCSSDEVNEKSKFIGCHNPTMVLKGAEGDFF
jgi:hypothetical protein